MKFLPLRGDNALMRLTVVDTLLNLNTPREQ
jgi:hypothetical protein